MDIHSGFVTLVQLNKDVFNLSSFQLRVREVYSFVGEFRLIGSHIIRDVCGECGSKIMEMNNQRLMCVWNNTAARCILYGSGGFSQSKYLLIVCKSYSQKV